MSAESQEKRRKFAEILGKNRREEKQAYKDLAAATLPEVAPAISPGPEVVSARSSSKAHQVMADALKLAEGTPQLSVSEALALAKNAE